MIVWLASYPRSGNTFARILLNNLAGLQTADRYIPTHAQADTDKRFAQAIGFQGHDSLESLDKCAEQVVVKTHELPSDDRPAIYVVRDGRDAITSYAHFYLTFERPCEPKDYPDRYRSTLHNMITMTANFGGWGQHVTKWTSRPQTAIVRYEDLLTDPVSTLNKALTKTGLRPIGEDAGKVPTFQELKTIAPRFFRRGQVGSYLEEMPKELQDLFWEHHGTVMESLGYWQYQRQAA